MYGVMSKEAPKLDALFRDGGLSISRLQTFLEVAEHRGLSRAAPGNATRQSQMSRQLKELETFFGGALMRRSHDGLTLTPLGEQLARDVRVAFQAFASLREEAHAEASSIRVAAGDSWIQWALLPHLKKLQMKGMRLELVTRAPEEILEEVRDARVDLGIGTLPHARNAKTSKPRDLFVRALGDVSFAVFASTKLVAKGAHGRAILRDAPLALRVADHVAAQHIAGRDIDLLIHCDTYPQVAQAIKTGLVAGILPQAARRELVPSGFVMRAVSMPDERVESLALIASARAIEQRPKLALLAERLYEILRAALR